MHSVFLSNARRLIFADGALQDCDLLVRSFPQCQCTQILSWLRALTVDMNDPCHGCDNAEDRGASFVQVA